MWSTLLYANTFICTPAHGGRAGNRGDRAPVLVRRYRPPVPEAPRQCRGVVDHHDGTRPAWHRSDGPPGHAGVAPTRPRGAPAPLLAPAHHRAPLRGWGLRVPPGPVAPQAADVRHTHEPVAARAGRRGPWRPGPDAAPGQRRHQACGPAPLARGLDAGHTLAPQARSRVGPKKQRRDPLLPRARAQPPWGLGWSDAGGWRRLAQPAQPGGTAAEATHQFQELPPPPADPDPQALAWYGLRRRPEPPPQAEPRRLRCVTGRPVRAVTSDWLAWCSAQRAAQGFTARRLLWENASWHRSQAVRPWRRPHNPRVKRGAAGGRLVVCHVPRNSPWRHPIEPQWVHGKRAGAEPDRLLRAAELAARVYAYYGCERETHLVMPKKVA